MLLVSCIGWTNSLAQHHQHMHPVPVDSVQTSQQKGMEHTSEESHVHEMQSILSRSLPMNLDGSGTSWHPNSTPMEGLHRASAGWHFMLHGRSFVRYTRQDMFNAGYRGAQTFGAPTWIMGMATKPLSESSQLAFRAMFTAEPITEGLDGYPLLFQTGETYKGIPLVDWQHPHDLIAELSITYSLQFTDKSGMFFYAALPGEPAIGPPAFMHRPSARHLPDSPIGHHWQDATHVTFGVGTLGLIYGPVKMDASIFTGREPDEERFGFDKPRFDSYSARISVNMSKRWSLQVSRAYIHGPEAHAPEIDMWRTAVALLYGHSSAKGHFSSAFVWGSNDPTGDLGAGNHLHFEGRNGTHLHAHTVTQQSFLLENDLSRDHITFYNRIELLQKDGAELGIPSLEDTLFWIGSGTVGLSKPVMRAKFFDTMVGVQASVYLVPEELQYTYGQSPVSGQFYVRLNLQ